VSGKGLGISERVGKLWRRRRLKGDSEKEETLD
jgi:hypothetical protein